MSIKQKIKIQFFTIMFKKSITSYFSKVLILIIIVFVKLL